MELLRIALHSGPFSASLDLNQSGESVMRFVTRLLYAAAIAVGGTVALADDVKPAAPATPAVPALPLAPARKADDKKPEKKLTEEEQAELEYKKYLEAQQKAMAEMAKLASHEQTVEVKVTGADKKNTLQTLTMTADNRVLALVAPPRGYGVPTKGASAEVQVFDLDGKKVDTWTIGFHAHAVNSAADGTVYVAGDGMVARFDKAGKPVGEPMELPHITELFKDKDALKKKAEEQLKVEKEQQAEMIKSVTKQMEDRIKKIEETRKDERTKAQERQLEQAKSMLKAYQDMETEGKGRTVESVIAGMTGRVRIINGIAVSEKDVFIACGEGAGYGYAIWRFDRDMKNPKQVLKGLGGCCGQMDVQTSGDDIIVAENTKHQFARYDRDGKKLGSYGKRGADTDPACFGSCCNPMNTRCAGGTGDIFTAESEGVVKRFSAAGSFIGVAGTVKISGGCKNVAIGVSGDGEKIVFCDQPGSKFYVLAKKTDKVEKK